MPEFNSTLTLYVMADAETPPSGLPPPFSNPEDDDSARILGAVTTVTSLALVIVLARFYVRLFMIRNFGWDVSYPQSPSF